MSPSRSVALTRLAATLAASVALAGTGSAADAPRPIMDRDPRQNVRVASQSLKLSLNLAVWGADVWLEGSSCREVLRDFTNAQGVPLSRVLAERGVTAREQLRRVFFYEERGQHVCQGGRAMVTYPGSTVILVCSAFRQVAADPLEARALVIHELLHTLGLGENPPSSQQITKRVLARCLR